MNRKNLLRTSSENYSAGNRNETLTGSIIRVEKMCWSSCSLCRCWLIVNVEVWVADKKIQVKEVRNWGGGREEFRLVELSRWIVASEWIIRMCTGYLYPDGHVSLHIWTRANRIIRWADREQVSWLCITEFGKDKFWNCLRIIHVEEMRKFGKDKFWNCPKINSMMRISIWNKDAGELEESFASGKSAS